MKIDERGRSKEPDGLSEGGDQRETGRRQHAAPRASTDAPGHAARRPHVSILRHGLLPRSTLVRLACAVAILVGAGAVIGVTRSGPASPAFVSDDFNRAVLSSRWSVVDPLGDSTVGTEGTWTRDAWLRISVPAGPEHSDIDDNETVRVVQPSRDRDFRAEISFVSEPGRNQSQGFLVQQNSANWIRFAFHHDGTALHVRARTSVDGETTTAFDQPVEAASPLGLRIDREGDDWAVSVSAPGTDDRWVPIATFAHALEVTGSGPDAGNTGIPSPAFTALVDYVIETDHWSLSEDTDRSIEVHRLETSVTGQGTITRTPDSASYPAGREVTLSAEPAPGWAFDGWSGGVRGTANPVTVAMDGERTVAARFVEDRTPPSVSAVTVTPTETSAVVRWTTDEPATSTVVVGTDGGYELGSFGADDLTRDHSVTIPDLAPGTTYHYSVRPADRVELTAETADATFTTPTSSGPAIVVWDGLDRFVGASGQPQTWVNIGGTVTDPDGVTSLGYSLNGGAHRPLSVGPDTRRLQAPGDFNADVPYDELASGANEVTLTATDGAGLTSSVSVQVDKAVVAPSLPYATDWARAGRIGDQAQVVDGRWSLDRGSVRIVELGYDRLLAVGDVGWRDYEVSVPVTVHALGPDSHTPTSGAPMVGLGLRWNGHTGVHGEQPARHWYPTGALGWYRWYDSNPRFELRGNEDAPLVRTPGRPIELGEAHMLKARVETVQGGVRYSWKAWPQGATEPEAWDLTLVEDAGPESGSVALIAHHAEAQFGDITVAPLGG